LTASPAAAGSAATINCIDTVQASDADGILQIEYTTATL
jgi:hypothetical protein